MLKEKLTCLLQKYLSDHSNGKLHQKLIYILKNQYICDLIVAK
jgi:hypothetical protein